MGISAKMRSASGAFCAVALAIAMALCAEAAPIDLEALRDVAEAEHSQVELGESAEMGVEESDEAAVGAMADYAATKKKLEDEIKKIEDTLKAKKAAAKKSFDASMKKTSETFSKLYAPSAKNNAKDILDSPLGSDGQSGISSMSKWAYAAQVGTWSKIAHKKIAKLEAKLAENRFNHFSTAVCKEVLTAKVDAIGDLKFEQEDKRIKGLFNKIKRDRDAHIAEDRADMEQKLNSYNLWNTDSTTQINGGFTGADPNVPHMLSAGELQKSGASRVGELRQAAHWAFAQSKAHIWAIYAQQRAKVKKEAKELELQHDLTLCRTGRKPPDPQMKFELQAAKNGLKKQLAQMPGAEAAAPGAAAEEASEEAAAKEAAPAAKEAAKEAAPAAPAAEDDEDEDLGESEGNTDVDAEGLSQNEAAVEFHKLIDASGGTETLAERAKMYKDLVESSKLEQQNIERRNTELVGGN